MSYDVAILGGGPAGLMAAWRAADQGRRVVLLEQADHVGGLAASFDVAGVAVDHGSHRLHPSVAPEILARLRAWLGADLQTRARNGRLCLAGRFVAFPPRPLDLARRLPPSFALALARDALRPARPTAARDEPSFATAVRAALGPTLATRFYEPYVRKIWGVEPTELDAELARRRVSARSGAVLVRRALRRRAGGGRTFLYPRHGFGQIAHAIADAAAAAGATIRVAARVCSVEPAGGAARVELADGEMIEAGLVCSTLPLNALVAMVRPTPPPAIAAAAARLRHRALTLVYVVVAGDRWTDFDAHYFPEPDVPIARVSEPKRYRASPDDPTDVTVLCAEIPCSVGDATWTADAADLGALVAASLARADLPSVRPLHVELRRVARAYPVYDRGFGDALATLEDWAASLRRVLTLGRQGLFAHDNTHHALAMGWAAADSLTGGADWPLDRARWDAARDGFRSHVVED